MSVMERVVVGTDFSERAGWAEQRAADLARALGCAVDLVHAVDTTGQALLPGRDVDTFIRAALERRAQDLARQHDLVVNAVLESGQAHRCLLDRADTFTSSLTVLGAHGGHFVQDLLFGSTAERVLRGAQAPVLIVKHPPQGAYTRAAIGVDFSPSAQAALRMVSLLPPMDLVAVHAVESPFENWLGAAGASREEVEAHHRELTEQARAQMRQFVLDLPDALREALHAQLDVDRARFEVGYPSQVVASKVVAVRADLLVLGKHGRAPGERWLAGSVAERLARTAPCDVLIVPS